MTRYQRQKEKFWGKPVPAGLRHGVTSNVRKIYGCRCVLCSPGQNEPKRTWREPGRPDRAATHVERQKKLRDGKKGQPVPPGTKHGIYTSRVYQCKCPICVAAKREVYAKQAEAWRATSHGRWTTVGDYETICWPPKGAGPEWTCPHPHHQEVA